MPYSISITKCPLALVLWLKFNIACDEESRQKNLLKSLFNPSPHLETKRCKPKNKTNTNANPTVVIRYSEFRLNGILWRLARVHRIWYNPRQEFQLANVVHTPRSAPSKYFMKRSEKTRVLLSLFHVISDRLQNHLPTYRPSKFSLISRAW